MTKTETPYDVVGNIIAFEDGQLDNAGVLELFSHLIKTGLVNDLQGFYGRTARDLVVAGHLTEKGDITT